MASLSGDIRFGFRMLRKDAGSSVLAVFSVALGIAAVTAIFSVAYAVLFDPFPYRDYERVASLGITSLKGPQGRGMFTIPEYRSIRERSRALEDTFAMGFDSLRLTGAGEPEFVWGKLMSPNAFEFLGVKPLLGRTFLADDYGAGNAPRPVIILSHTLWQKRFASDPGVVGREVLLNGLNHTVIGVMPRRFTLYTSPGQPSIWLPLPHDPGPQMRVLLHGRLKPGASLQAASAELHSVLAPFAEAQPKDFPPGGFTIRLRPFSDWVRPWIRTTVYMLLAAVGFLLLIACCNVANLLLARACVRRKEMSVRLSVGASRWHLVRQLLAESVMLSLAGGCVGVLLAFWGSRGLVSLLPPYAINSEMEFRLNGAVLAASFAVAVITGILFGLIPAFHSCRVNLSEVLKDSGRGSSRLSGHWTRKGLIVLGFAFSMILLVGAGLMIRTFAGLTRGGARGGEDRILTMFLPSMGQAEPDLPRRNAFYRSVLEGLQGAPGLKSAAFTSTWPPRTWPVTPIEIAGGTSAQKLEAAMHGVSEGYFESMGIPLLRGSAFSASDVLRGEPVAVINETMARRFFSGPAGPVGRNLKLAIMERPQFAKSAKSPWVRIVGVVADAKNAGPREDPLPEAFVPYTLTPWAGYGLAVRAGTDTGAALRTVRSRIAAIDRDQPLSDILTLDDRVAAATAQERFITVLLCVFAGVGLALAAIGIYGVMSYSVSQRTQEIGIRMAVGAGATDVVWLVAAEALRTSAAGVVVGAFGSFALTRLIRTQLYGVTSTDPAVFAIVSVFLAMVGLGACYVPARRAAAVSPTIALRAE